MNSLKPHVSHHLPLSCFTDWSEAQWKHLEMFYDIDRHNCVRMAPERTMKPVALLPFTDM